MEYPEEKLSEHSDDGTMPSSRDALSEAVVGHRIVKVGRGGWKSERYPYNHSGMALMLDTGKVVVIQDVDDCCAYTQVEGVVQHLDQIEHVITGVGTTDGFTSWHIYAEMGDVLEFQVGWSCGNPFYYAYGFNIQVLEAEGLQELTISQPSIEG